MVAQILLLLLRSIRHVATVRNPKKQTLSYVEIDHGDVHVAQYVCDYYISSNVNQI